MPILFINEKDKGGPTVERLDVTQNGIYQEADKVYSPVVVEVPQPSMSTLEVSENGNYDAPSGTGYNRVEVNVPLPQNAYLEKSLSGLPASIARFSDGQALPLSNLKIGIEAVQSGTGDPSPSNPRSISGWSSVNVARCGKNLVEETISGATIGSAGLVTTGAFDLQIFKVKAGVKYTITTNTDVFIGGFFTEKPALNSRTYDQARIIDGPLTFVAPIDGWGAFRTKEEYATPQVEVGTTATTYSPYNGHTYTIALGDTYYGGELDVVSGNNLNNRDYVDLGTLTWGNNGTDCVIAEVSDMEIDGFAISDKLVKVATGTAVRSMPNFSFKLYDSSSKIAVKYEGINPTNASELLSGFHLLYELDTPTPFTTQPTAVKSLEGVNNIFADSGQILDGEYLSKGV